MDAKRFFYACAGLLCLALAFHLGATTATAQKAATPEVAAAYWSNSIVLPSGGSAGGNVVVMRNGDIYLQSSSYAPGWVKLGNAVTP
jgi:hypothetical protein